MNPVVQAVVYTLAPLGATVTGGIVAAFRPPGEKAQSYIQHFAAGVVTAAIAVEVLPPVKEQTPWSTVAGGAIGMIVMLGLNVVDTSSRSQAAERYAKFVDRAACHNGAGYLYRWPADWGWYVRERQTRSIADDRADTRVVVSWPLRRFDLQQLVALDEHRHYFWAGSIGASWRGDRRSHTVRCIEIHTGRSIGIRCNRPALPGHGGITGGGARKQTRAASGSSELV